MTKCWIQSRWNKRTEASNEGGDYINCPMNEVEYDRFIDALLAARNYLGVDRADPWTVNTDAEYLEERRVPEKIG